MIKENKYKHLLFIGSFLVFLILPFIAFSQADILGEDILLTEYLFPISSYEKSGSPEVKRGVECEEFTVYEPKVFSPCADLPVFEDPEPIKEWLDGGGVLSSERAKFSYKFNVTEQANYVFQINVSNDQDNFKKLTRDQIDRFLSDLGWQLDDMLNEIGEATSFYALSAVGTIESQKYDLFRSLVFSVYVDGQAAENKKGFIFVKNTEPNDSQAGEIVIDDLSPGEHTIYLHFLSDFYYDFSAITDLPDYFNDFENADLNFDQTLDANPIIHSLAMDAIDPADDIVGIRIYKNLENKDP